MPFKWNIPWITKNPINSSKVLSQFFASFLITGLHRIISPWSESRGKASTLAALSFFLYFLFICRDLCSLTKAIDKEYFFPRISFLIRSYMPLFDFAEFAEFFYFHSPADAL